MPSGAAGLILGLPRGGVPVAFEIAQHHNAAMDVFVVRKIGLPDQPELAIGAIASGGVRVLDQVLIDRARLPGYAVEELTALAAAEVARREAAYRGDRPMLEVTGRDVVIADDGLATGSTMRAAVEAVRSMQPHSLTVAVPVGAPESIRMLEPLVDDLICPIRPERFQAVGAWYRDFSQTTDQQVVDLLARSPSRS